MLSPYSPLHATNLFSTDWRQYMYLIKSLTRRIITERIRLKYSNRKANSRGTRSRSCLCAIWLVWKEKPQIYTFALSIDQDGTLQTTIHPIDQSSKLLGGKLYRYSVINRWKNCKNLTWQFTCIKPNVIRSSDRFIFNRYRFFFIGLWLLDSMTLSFIMADKVSETCKIDPYRPLSWHIRYL